MIAILGTGKMGEALLSGLLRAGRRRRPSSPRSAARTGAPSSRSGTGSG